MNNKTSLAMTCYAKLIGSFVASLCLFGAASYLFDIENASSGIFFGVCFGWAVIYSLVATRFLNIFVKENARDFLWYLIMLAAVGANFIVANYTHSLRNTTVELTSICDAIDSNEEYLCVSNAPEKDLQHRGVYKTYDYMSSRWGTEIVFEAFVVHPFIGVEGGYWGYRIQSEPYALSYKQLDKREKEFYDGLEAEIREKDAEYLTRYFQRVEKNDEDYDNYQFACQACNDTCKYAGQKLVVFYNCQMSKEASSTYWNKWVIFGIPAFALLMGIFFLFFRKSERKYHALTNERQRYYEIGLDFLSTRKNWWSISLVLLIVGYYLVALSNGYNGDGKNLIHWGALARFTLLENGEWWRLISYALMHLNFGHLILNVACLALFIFATPWFSKSWHIWGIFLICSVIAGLACVFLEDYGLVVGASGGIMGLFGTKIAFAFMLMWEKYTTEKSSKPKKKKSNLSKKRQERRKKDKNLQVPVQEEEYHPHLDLWGLLLAWDAWLVVIPTLLYDLIGGFSTIDHIAGLIAGIAVGFIFLYYLDDEDTNDN